MQRFQPAHLLQPALIRDLPKKRSGLRFAAAPTAANSEERDFAEVAKDATIGGKIILGLQSATADFLDVAVFFVIGIALTSIFNTAIDQRIIGAFATNSLSAILALMVLAGILGLCSTTDAFIAATFTQFPFEAKLAFMVFGAMLDVKLFWLYGLIFRRRFVIFLSLGLIFTVAFLCWRLGFVMPNAG